MKNCSAWQCRHLLLVWLGTHWWREPRSDWRIVLPRDAAQSLARHLCHKFTWVHWRWIGMIEKSKAQWHCVGAHLFSVAVYKKSHRLFYLKSGQSSWFALWCVHCFDINIYHSQEKDVSFGFRDKATNKMASTNMIRSILGLAGVNALVSGTPFCIQRPNTHSTITC